MVRPTRLDDYHYLLSTLINDTLTYFAAHSERFRHDQINRYLAGERLTPRKVLEHVLGLFVTPSTLLLCVTSLILFSVCNYTAQAKVPNTPKIVFTSIRAGNSDIYIMNTDGTEEVRLTQDLSEDSDPKWAPTGDQILFVSDREDSVPDLFLMNADGTDIRKVFKDTVHRTSPAFARDGKRIAYLRDTERAIYTATITGEEEKQLVRVGEKSNGEPTWSPNGTEIAFVSTRGTPRGGSQIRILNTQNNRERILLPDELPLMRSPAWSPSGDEIAFSWLNLDIWDVNELLRWGGGNAPWKNETLYVVTPDGRDLRRLLNREKAGAVGPAWSPRGDEIVYRRHEPVFQLFTFVVGSQNSKQLTRTGMNKGADWFDPSVLSVHPQDHLLTTLWGQLKQK